MVASGGWALPSPILLSGIVPPAAEGYYPRPETGLDLRAGLQAGETVVLTDLEGMAAAPGGQGGTGKTQLAVAFAQALWSMRAVQMLVWISATSRDAIVAGFARAAAEVGVDEMASGAETAAGRFVGWLAQTRRPWSVIIDDLTDLADLDRLWPSGPAGQVVITTRLPSSMVQHGLSRAAPGSPAGMGLLPGLRIASIGGFSRREATAYLSVRLADRPGQLPEARELGEDLDGLPLGLAQAAAVLGATGQSCRDYRVRLAERRRFLSGVRVDAVSTAILATWSLAAECADQLPPAGLAWPALALAALLGDQGIPGAVLTSPAACGYILGRPSAAAVADQDVIRAAVTNLARASLVSIDPANPVRTVRMHRSVRAAVLAYLPPADVAYVTVAAADALVQAWPEPVAGPLAPDQLPAQYGPFHDGHDGSAQHAAGRPAEGQIQQAQLQQALRDCAAALWNAGANPQVRQAPQVQQALWRPDAHPVLFRAGRSLEEAGMPEAAIGYWQRLLAVSSQQLGAGNAYAAAARNRLAGAYEAAGRSGEAISVFASALADTERNSGREHPDTITARGRLAHAYGSAGQPAEAVTLYEEMVTDASRQLGLTHPVTLSARASLADAYLTAGQGLESLTTYRMLLTDSQRLLGPGHAATWAARDNLAAAFLATGRSKDAIEYYRQAVADAEAASGPDHPSAIAARARLAAAYRQGGKLKDGIALQERVLADAERVRGPGHPDTRTARADLAAAYRQAGREADALAQYERALAISERLLGPDHPVTQAARDELEAFRGS